MRNQADYSKHRIAVVRAVAFVTAVAFTWTNTAWASGVGLTSRPFPIRASSDQHNAFQSKNGLAPLSFPLSACNIKSHFKGNRDRLVIHIQDAHANEEAQRNIAVILSKLAREQNLKLVHLEGASGALNTDLFSFFPSKIAKSKVSDYFLREGRLRGAEYAAIVDYPQLRLYGVEDPEIYEANRDAYLDALEAQDRNAVLLGKLKLSLKKLSRFIFQKELRELYDRRERFQENGSNLNEYVRYLTELAGGAGLVLEDFKQLAILKRLSELEGKIDFETVSEAVGYLTSELKEKLIGDRLRVYVANTARFHSGTLSRGDYYRHLETTVKEAAADLAVKHESVLHYLLYVQLHESLDVELFGELERLFEKVKATLLPDEEAVTLDRLFRIVSVYEKLVNFSLTRDDADFFYTNRVEFRHTNFEEKLSRLISKYEFDADLPEHWNSLDADVSLIERFYALALKRDRVLVRRAVRQMEIEDEQISVIITGGFHTAGIEDYLREQGYSYLVVTPNITEHIDELREAQLYEAAVRETPLPIGTLLRQAYVSSQSNTFDNPRFQMAPPTLALEAVDVTAFLKQVTGQASSLITDPQFIQAHLYLSLVILYSVLLAEAKSSETLSRIVHTAAYAEANPELIKHLVSQFEGVREEQTVPELPLYWHRVPGAFRVFGLGSEADVDRVKRTTPGFRRLQKGRVGEDEVFFTARFEEKSPWVPDWVKSQLAGLMTRPELRTETAQAELLEKNRRLSLQWEIVTREHARAKDIIGSKISKLKKFDQEVASFLSLRERVDRDIPVLFDELVDVKTKLAAALSQMQHLATERTSPTKRRLDELSGQDFFTTKQKINEALRELLLMRGEIVFAAIVSVRNQVQAQASSSRDILSPALSKKTQTIVGKFEQHLDSDGAKTEQMLDTLAAQSVELSQPYRKQLKGYQTATRETIRKLKMLATSALAEELPVSQEPPARAREAGYEDEEADAEIHPVVEWLGQQRMFRVGFGMLASTTVLFLLISLTAGWVPVLSPLLVFFGVSGLLVSTASLVARGAEISEIVYEDLKAEKLKLRRRDALMLGGTAASAGIILSLVPFDNTQVPEQAENDFNINRGPATLAPPQQPQTLTQAPEPTSTPAMPTPTTPTVPAPETQAPVTPPPSPSRVPPTTAPESPAPSPPRQPVVAPPAVGPVVQAGLPRLGREARGRSLRFLELVPGKEPTRIKHFKGSVLSQAELEQIRAVISLLNITLPKPEKHAIGKKWWERRNPDPAWDEVERLIHEGKLFTVEDWAEYFFAPLMIERGLLDGPLQKRMQFLKNFASKLKEVKQKFRGRAATPFLTESNPIIWMSLRSVNSDYWALNDRSWGTDLGERHGDFSLQELFGLAYERIREEEANSLEVHQLIRNERAFETLLNFAPRKAKYALDLRRLRTQFAAGNSQLIQALGGFNHFLNRVTQIILSSRLVDPYLDENVTQKIWSDTEHKYDSLRGRVDYKRDEETGAIVPGTPQPRGAEHNLRLQWLGRHPYTRERISGLRRLVGSDQFAPQDPNRVAKKESAEYLTLIVDLLTQLAKLELGADDDAQRFLDRVRALAGGQETGKSLPVLIDEIIWDLAQRLESEREDTTTDADKLSRIKNTLDHNLNSRRAQAPSGSYPTLSEANLDLFANTIYDAMAGSLLMRQVNFDRITRDFVLWMGPKPREAFKLLFGGDLSAASSGKKNEFHDFLVPRRFQKFGIGNSMSLLDIYLSGEAESLFAINVDGQITSREGMSVARDIVDIVQKNLPNYPPEAQTRFLAILAWIDEIQPTVEQLRKAKKNGKTVSRSTYKDPYFRPGGRRSQMMQALLAGKYDPEIAHPADLWDELETETPEGRDRMLHALLTRAVGEMLLNQYKNTILAWMKEVYERSFQHSVELLEREKGYALQFDPELKRFQWRETTTGRAVTEASERARLFDEWYGIFEKQIDQEMRILFRVVEAASRLRPKIEHLVGKTFNLSEPFFRDSAKLFSLVRPYVERFDPEGKASGAKFNRIVEDIGRIIDNAGKFTDADGKKYEYIDVQDRTDHLRLREAAAKWADFIDTVAVSRSSPERRIHQGVVKGRAVRGVFRVDWILDPTITPPPKTASDKVKRQHATNAEQHLALLLGLGEEQERYGLTALKRRLETLQLYFSRYPNRYEDALRVSREYENAIRHVYDHEKPDVIEQPGRLVEERDSYFGRTRGTRGRAVLSSLLFGIVRRGMEYADPDKRMQEVDKDFDVEINRMTVVTKLLQDTQKNNRYRFALDNPITGKKETHHALGTDEESDLGWVFYEGPRSQVNLTELFYQSVLPHHYQAFEVHPGRYTRDPQVEGAVNGVLTFAMDPQALPGDDPAKIAQVVQKSLNDVIQVVKVAKREPQVLNTLMRIVFERVWEREKLYEEYPAWQTGRKSFSLQAGDLTAQGSAEWLRGVFYRDKPVQQAFETFKRRLPHDNEHFGTYLNLWREHIHRAAGANARGPERTTQIAGVGVGQTHFGSAPAWFLGLSVADRAVGGVLSRREVIFGRNTNDARSELRNQETRRVFLTHAVQVSAAGLTAAGQTLFSEVLLAQPPAMPGLRFPWLIWPMKPRRLKATDPVSNDRQTQAIERAAIQAANKAYKRVVVFQKHPNLTPEDLAVLTRSHKGEKALRQVIAQKPREEIVLVPFGLGPGEFGELAHQYEPTILSGVFSDGVSINSKPAALNLRALVRDSELTAEQVGIFEELVRPPYAKWVRHPAALQWSLDVPGQAGSQSKIVVRADGAQMQLVPAGFEPGAVLRFGTQNLGARVRTLPAHLHAKGLARPLPARATRLAVQTNEKADEIKLVTAIENEGFGMVVHTTVFAEHDNWEKGQAKLIQDVTVKLVARRDLDTSREAIGVVSIDGVNLNETAADSAQSAFSQIDEIRTRSIENGFVAGHVVPVEHPRAGKRVASVLTTGELAQISAERVTPRDGVRGRMPSIGIRIRGVSRSADGQTHLLRPRLFVTDAASRDRNGKLQVSKPLAIADRSNIKRNVHLVLELAPGLVLKRGETAQFQLQIVSQSSVLSRIDSPALPLPGPPRASKADLAGLEEVKRRVNYYYSHYFEDKKFRAQIIFVQQYFEALFGVAPFQGLKPPLRRLDSFANRRSLEQDRNARSLLEGFLTGIAQEGADDPKKTFEENRKAAWDDFVLKSAQPLIETFRGDDPDNAVIQRRRRLVNELIPIYERLLRAARHPSLKLDPIPDLSLGISPNALYRAPAVVQGHVAGLMINLAKADVAEEKARFEAAVLILSDAARRETLYQLSKKQHAFFSRAAGSKKAVDDQVLFNMMIGMASSLADTEIVNSGRINTEAWQRWVARREASFKFLGEPRSELRAQALARAVDGARHQTKTILRSELRDAVTREPIGQAIQAVDEVIVRTVLASGVRVAAHANAGIEKRFYVTELRPGVTDVSDVLALLRDPQVPAFVHIGITAQDETQHRELISHPALRAYRDRIHIGVGASALVAKIEREQGLQHEEMAQITVPEEVLHNPRHYRTVWYRSWVALLESDARLIGFHEDGVGLPGAKAALPTELVALLTRLERLQAAVEASRTSA